MSGDIKDVAGHFTTEAELLRIQAAIFFSIVERFEQAHAKEQGKSQSRHEAKEASHGFAL